MLVSRYLPTLGFSLWPCAVLLLVFIPVSFWHERNWRRTLAEYAQVRKNAGVSDGEWPPPGMANLMGVQPGLILFACAILGLMVAVAVVAALMWPRTPPGFEHAINPLDLPYVWSMIVAAAAAVIAGVAIALDVARNPWSKVARSVRRAIYAPAEQRSRCFAEALAVDPGITQDAASGTTVDNASRCR